VRNLIIAPAGARSLHRRWMGDPARRSYDVWLNGYDDEALARFAGDPVRVFDARRTMKWQMMARHLGERRAEVLAYDAVWFPDDDLAIDAPAVELLFALVHGLGLWLAQPCLGEGSHASHPVTLENRSFTVRFSNFVEVMAPVLSRHGVERCGPTFGDSVSGWGLDRVWPRMLGDPRDRIAVVDAVPMVHTQPVGGGSWYARLPIPPEEEERAVAARRGVTPPFVIRQYGGIPREAGADPAAGLAAGARFLWRIARGAPASQRWKGRFWRRQCRSVRAGRAAAGEGRGR